LEFQLTTACGWKLLPVIARVKADEPAGMLVGETFATMGEGAREGAPPPEPPEPLEQPVKRARAAKVLKRRQKEAER
jgi:hypothetical protein